MKPLLILSLIAIAALPSCQNGKVVITPQQEAAGVAALVSIGESVKNKTKPAPAAIDAGLAALKAYQEGAVVAVPTLTPPAPIPATP